MKVSLLAVAHLSLVASAADTRLRRLKRDSAINEMRNTLLQVRDIDGTAVIDGPEGATARQPISDESSGGLLAKAVKDPVTTVPPEEVVASEKDSHDVHAKSGKSQYLSMNATEMSMNTKPSNHHHNKESKADKETAMSAPMAKAGKTNVKKVHESSSLSMQYESKSNKEALSMDSKASKSDTKQEDALSMPAAKTMKEEANEFWAEYEAENGQESSLVESKASKSVVSLSMDVESKAAKTERMANLSMSLPAGKTMKHDAADDNMSLAKSEKILSMDSKAAKDSKPDLSMSLPAGKTTKQHAADDDMSLAKSEKVLSMDSKAAKDDHAVTMEITEDYVSDLSTVDAKAGKSLSMDGHRLFPKSGKSKQSLSM